MAKAAAPLAERLGTAHGRREWSEVVRTSFERASRTPQAQVEIHYDSYANLVAAGIIPPSTAALNPPPRAFPGREDSRAYVPDAPSDRR